ncbi:MAG: hypothetical protein RJA94_1255 [Pseudomonadota bacterium]|jgi:hypothetical protein
MLLAVVRPGTLRLFPMRVGCRKRNCINAAFHGLVIADVDRRWR